MTFGSPKHELSKRCINFELDIIGDVTGQVKDEMINCLGLLRLANNILMLNAIQANELAFELSLTFISLITCALLPKYLHVSHLRLPCKKRST